MNSVYVYAFGFLVLSIVLFAGFMWWIYRGVQEEIQKSMDANEGNEAAQEEIRKKLIKALYPPRFNRD
jgi:hypothetical protein